MFCRHFVTNAETPWAQMYVISGNKSFKLNFVGRLCVLQKMTIFVIVMGVWFPLL